MLLSSVTKMNLHSTRTSGQTGDSEEASPSPVAADLYDAVSAEEVYIPSDSADAHIGSDGVSAIGSRNRRAKRIRKFFGRMFRTLCSCCLYDAVSADKGTVTADLSDIDSADKGTVKADLSDTDSADKGTVTVQLLDVLHSKLGVFELQHFLSNGRFSKVAKCKGVETKDLLAVKIYKKYDTGSPALLNKELAMLKKIRGLDQDHIVQFLDEFEHKGHTCLAFEMLDRNLHELLRGKRGNRLSLAEIRPIAQQVLTALESLKTAGVIHGNIKPHNIMLMKHDHLRVKLIGFSAAIAAAEVKRGDAMQPFAYRSPDVILGLPITEAVDVWCLGRVMVTMYLGSMPFPQKRPYYQMKAIVETLGQPRDELLSDGANTHLYFSENQDSTTPAWRLKTAEEYEAVTGFPPQKHRGSSTKFNSLIDLFKTMTEVNGKNNVLEIMLEDANRLMKFYLTKEKSLIEERDSLLVTVNRLQQTLQEQCNLRVENERLKNDMEEMKQQKERTAKAGAAELQRLVGELGAEGERHKRELEAVWQQSRREVEDARREGLHQLEAQDAEGKNLLERKDLDLEELKKRLKDQERERQSELLKLQMEFGAKLARVQSTAQQSQQQQQQQQHGSNLIPQSVFKRKLQFFQEEKNKEIVALRQRIKELEENQRAGGFNDSRLKKRRIQFD